MWRLDHEKMDGAFLTRKQFKFTYFYICKKIIYVYIGFGFKD